MRQWQLSLLPTSVRASSFLHYFQRATELCGFGCYLGRPLTGQKESSVSVAALDGRTHIDVKEFGHSSGSTQVSCLRRYSFPFVTAGYDSRIYYYSLSRRRNAARR